MRLGTLYFVLWAGLFCFIMGVCASEAVVETFWPQLGNVLWIRAVGGLAGLAAFALALRLMPRWFIRRASLYGLVCTTMIVVGVLTRLAFAWSR
jgi:hypothetical protein